MNIKIVFDMDGTLADFYSCPDWLKYLETEKTKPYRIAKTLVHGRALANRINKLQALGVEVSIVSWASKNYTPEYFDRIKRAKENWLKKHYPSIEWNSINITKYGYAKENYAINGLNILFDDNAEIREAWESCERGTCKALSELNILNELDNMIAELNSAI